MKKILALLLAAGMIVLAGCNNGEQAPSQTFDTISFEVPTELYTVKDAFSAIYSLAGADVNSTDGNAQKTIVNAMLKDCGTTLEDIYMDLSTSSSPSKGANVKLALDYVGIPVDYIDWSTINEVFQLPGMSSESPTGVKADIVPDYTEFAETVHRHGVTDYWNMINQMCDASTYKVPAPDFNLMQQLADQMSVQDVLTQYMSTSNMISSDTIMFKLSPTTKTYYELARRDGCKYASFYATVSNDKNAPIDMKENIPGTNIPIWQYYFCAYAINIENTFNMKVKDGIINNVNNGIEIWWSPTKGATLELDVYESGYIRMVYGSDDRYTAYLKDSGAGTFDMSSSMWSALQVKLSRDYALTDGSFKTLVTLAQVFNLPCAQIDLNISAANLNNAILQQWTDAASLFVTQLHVIDGSDRDTITPYELSKQLVAFACIGRDTDTIKDITACIQLLDDRANDEATLAVNNEYISEYQKFTDTILSIVGSKSYFMVENYNSLITNVTYVPIMQNVYGKIEDKMNKMTESNPFNMGLARVVFVDICNDINMKSVFDKVYTDVDTDAVGNILSAVETNPIDKQTKIGDAIARIIKWFCVGRSSVTQQKISGVDLSKVQEYRDITLAEIEANKDVEDILVEIFDSIITHADVHGVSGADSLVTTLLN